MLGLKLNHVSKRGHSTVHDDDLTTNSAGPLACPLLIFHLEPLLLTSVPTWISNYIHYIVWDEITYPFPDFNGVTIEGWEWISKFTQRFPGHVITYPCWDWSLTMLVKGAPAGTVMTKFWSIYTLNWHLNGKNYICHEQPHFSVFYVRQV